MEVERTSLTRFKREPFPLIPLPGTAYSPDANGWELWWRRHIAETRQSLAPLFGAYMATYREAEAASLRFAEWARRFDTQTSDERYAEGYEPFAALSTIEAYKGTLRAIASALLLALDGLLSNLRVRVRRGRERCTDDGPELRNGVTVDRALDAIGNYVRHEHEWRLHDYRGTWPDNRQLRSIAAIAKLSTTMPIEWDDAEEAYIQYTQTNPTIMLLDMLSNFEDYGPDSSYENVERKVLDAGICTIKATFAANTVEL